MTEPQVSRRSFINLVGRAGGASAAYSTMVAMGLMRVPEAYAGPPQIAQRAGGASARVVIIGAGLAGMLAAWELSKAGFQVRVLEAQGRAGGRLWTLRGGDTITEDGSSQRVTWDREPGLYFNAGAARLPHHHEAILGYCREFGVPLNVIMNDNRNAYLHDTAAFGGRPQRARQVINDARGQVAELAAKAVSQRLLDRQVTEDDLARLRDFLRAFGDLDREARYRGSSRAGYAEPPGGPRPGRIREPLDLLEIAKAESWRWNMFFGESYEQAATMMEPVGGMDAIPRAFYQRVQRFVTLNAQVTKLERVGAGARVTWRDRASGRVQSVPADYVIVTVPLPALRTLDSDFSPSVKRAIEDGSKVYIPAVKVAFQSDRRWWEEDHRIFGGISWTNRSSTQLWYPTGGIHGRKGIVVGAYIWTTDIGNRFAGMSPAQRAAATIEDCKQIHPDFDRLVARPASVAWSKIPFIGGAWAEWDDDEPARRNVYPVLLEPDGPYWFAGEHMSHINGWQEGAIRATQHVLNRIADRVRLAPRTQPAARRA